MKRTIVIATSIMIFSVLVYVFQTHSQPHFQGANRRSLSEVGRSTLFTDRRPFDQSIIDKDLRNLTASLTTTPNDARLLISRGFIYAALTQFDSAIPDFQKAAQLNPNADTADPYGPNHNRVYYLLALAEWQSGNPTDAVKDFSRVIAADSTFARAYFYRGIASLELGDRTTAIKDIETASEMESGQLKTVYQSALDEIEGRPVRERIVSTYVICFLSNNPPQNRPFGYIWEIQHRVSQW